MVDGERNSFKSVRGNKGGKDLKLPDFMKPETIRKLAQQDKQDRYKQAMYASTHGAPDARDIIRSADFSQPGVPASMEGGNAYDIIRSTFSSPPDVSALMKRESAHAIIRSLDLPQSIPDKLGLSPRNQWIDTLRGIEDTFAEDKMPETPIHNYDKYSHRNYPNSFSSFLNKVYALSEKFTLDKIVALKDSLACFKEQELQTLRRQELADKVDIISDPQLQTDRFGYALSYGEVKVRDDQQAIKKLLSEEYERVSSSVMPGDRMVIYSPSQDAYVTAGLVEDCDQNTWEPTSVSYLVQDGGCIHQGHPDDFYKTTNGDTKVEFYRRKKIEDELIILEKTVENIEDAKVIIMGDTHTDYACSITYRRINLEYLKDGDTIILEQPEAKDQVFELDDGRKIVQGTWDSAKFREKFKGAVWQQIRIADEIALSQTTAADQLARLGQECYNGKLWANLPKITDTMYEILKKDAETTSALAKELQDPREDFDNFSFQRIMSLRSEIERRTKQSPDNVLSVLVGQAHILTERERKALELHKYPQRVVCISRHPNRDLRAGRGYARKISNSSESEASNAKE